MIYDLYKQKIAEANAGDKKASLWLIKNFCSTIENNRDSKGNPHVKPSGIHTQFHEGMLDYFHKSFTSILEGVKADKALGINKGETGADKLSKYEVRDREVKWCLEIIKLKNSGKYPLMMHAKAQAARKFNVKQSAIDKAWKNKISKLSAMISYEMSKQGK
jgi:hypothetical protein